MMQIHTEAIRGPEKNHPELDIPEELYADGQFSVDTSKLLEEKSLRDHGCDKIHATNYKLLFLLS